MHSIQRAASFVYFLLVVLFLVQTVLAQQRPTLVVLNWNRLPGAEGCMGRQELEQTVENRIGRAIFTTVDDADLLIQGTIVAETPGYWQISYFMYNTSGKLIGQRYVTIHSKDCRELDGMISLLLTLMVESLEESFNLQHVDDKLLPLSGLDEGLIDYELDVEPATVLSIGYLPRTSVGFSILTSLTVLHSLRVFISMTFWESVKVRKEGAGAKIDSWNADIGSCLRVLPLYDFDLEGCLAVQFGQLSGTGIDMHVLRNPQPWFISTSIGPSLSMGIGEHFFLRVDLTSQIPIRTTRFYYIDRNSETQSVQKRTIWQPFWIIPVARFGVGVRSP